jgi:tetratricopeptide (TPR) repeat protein
MLLLLLAMPAGDRIAAARRALQEPPARDRGAPQTGDEALPDGGAAAELDRLETALANAPDDLRAADAYRKAVIRAGAYDRALAFFERLTTDHPGSAYAWLNYGYAYVDKIPEAGSITQLILASEALGCFSRSLQLERTWVGLYTRGNSYLYWPVVFGRAPLGVADLEAAMAMVRNDPAPKAVHVRTWIALGDGYWRTGERERARATWREGLGRYPGDPELETRLERDDERLERYLYELRDPNRRIDTDLSPLWAEETADPAAGAMDGPAVRPIP